MIPLYLKWHHLTVALRCVQEAQERMEYAGFKDVNLTEAWHALYIEVGEVRQRLEGRQ